VRISPGAAGGSARAAGAAFCAIGALLAGAHPRAAVQDPSRVLVDRFQYTADEVARVSAGTPVAKLVETRTRNEVALVGALRIRGDKNRLVTWVQDIAQFRKAAELGAAHVVKSPVSETAFADLSLSRDDAADLKKCRVGSCELRMSEQAIGQLNATVQWDTPGATPQAERIVRQMLAGFATAYLAGGDAALGASGTAFGELLAGASAFQAIAPELVAYFEQYPNKRVDGISEVLYWSAPTDFDQPIVSLHHLVVYRRPAGDAIIVDKVVYASRVFDAGAVVLALQDAPDRQGYFVVAGGRLRSPKLTGAVARTLRNRIERTGVQWVETYLTWMRDSLGMESRADARRPSNQACCWSLVRMPPSAERLQ
jgi:hypothetical protein